MMSEKKRVGIFTRIYRSEPAMHEAIQSVLRQTYSDIRYYILVNEVTKSELEKYAEDARVVMLCGEKGQGFRTYAKKIAEDGNDYVMTVDADDWCETTYVEELVKYAENNHTDITACGYYFIKDGKRIGERNQTNMVWEVKDTGRVLDSVHCFFRPIWAKLMTSECILKCDFNELPESSSYGGYGGDTMLVFYVLSKAKRAGICEKKLYNYRMSSTSASYKLLQGRLDSDEMVHRFVGNILLELGYIDERVHRFMMYVYGNALIDTLRLLLNAKMTERERAEKIYYIFQKEGSKELLHRERIDALVIPEWGNPMFRNRFYEIVFSDIAKCAVTEQTTKQYLELFELFYPQWNGVLESEEFSIILKKKEMLDCLTRDNYGQLFDLLLDVLSHVKLSEAKTCLGLLRRLTKEALLKPMLLEKKFVLMYQDLIKLVNVGEREDALEKLHLYFVADKLPYGCDILVELWINLAASLEDANEFVMGKQLKTELLLQKGQQEVGRKEYEELLQMGVQDENMEYLKGLLREFD